MSADAGAPGRKVRLNAAAFLHGEQVGKHLVLISEDALVSELEQKVMAAFAKGGVAGRLVRLENGQGAHLPHDEYVGDVLRDGEAVTATLTEEVQPPPDPVPRMNEMLDFSEGAAKPADEPFEQRPPGPAECFAEEVMEVGPREPIDWEVGKLTPKLREFVSTRFKEVHGHVVDPGQGFITVSMQPTGANLAVMPIHYSIARIDVIEFERLCGRKIQEARRRLDYFQRSQEALGSLVDRGAVESEYAPNMLPYRYRADEEFGTLLNEADSMHFGALEGFRPVIVVDTSGAVGESLPFIRAALKRMLYSFVVAKSKFNLIKFGPQGRAVGFENHMVPPTAQKLREAEEWIDAARPCRAGSPVEFIEGLQHAMELYEADMVYFLTPGLPPKGDPEYLLWQVRERNVRHLPLHVIGIDCDAQSELLLRRLAEENQGSFRQKRFDGGLCLTEQRRAPPHHVGEGHHHDDARLTIGGQMTILDIMLAEQDAQTADWLGEQKRANRLLLTTATQQAVPEGQEVRAAALPLSDVYQGRGPTPRMQELIEGCRQPRGISPNRGQGQPVHRASSQPRVRGRQTAEELRRPSVANPWDRPSGVVKVSQMSAAEKLFGTCSGVGTSRTLSRKQLTPVR